MAKAKKKEEGSESQTYSGHITCTGKDVDGNLVTREYHFDEAKSEDEILALFAEHFGNNLGEGGDDFKIESKEVK